KMPQTRFIYIGLDKKKVSFDFAGIPNLTVIEKVPQEQLKKYFCESKVFAQFSISEGLPNTLCEAMLCECVATGSNVNGIPRVIRNKEYILEKKDVKKATEILERALNAEEKTGKKNREYIEKNYPPEARANALYQIIDSIYKTTNE
ncbi:MAG TPA: glycosyltransferase, partial [Bacteroidetes bacterium]|nr:glycosyltransferase [Bacteroidota bacterium]